MWLVLGSCSGSTYSSRINPRTDFDQISTFYCSECLGNIDTKLPRYDNPRNRELIREAINKEITARGYVINESESDLLVEFVVIIELKMDTVSQRTTNYRYWKGFETYPYNYEYGTMFINLVDRQSGELVWQGQAQRVLDKEPKNVEKRISKVVKEIFKMYPHSRIQKL